MSSQRVDKSRVILKETRDAIEEWIDRRKEMVKAIEEAADGIHKISQDASIAKVVGSSVGAVAGVTAGILGVFAIVATGGLAAPLVAAGAASTVLGVGGAITTGGADIAKAVELPKRMELVKQKTSLEIDHYIAVVHMLARLYQIIVCSLRGRTKSSRMADHKDIEHLTSYYLLNLFIADDVSIASARNNTSKGEDKATANTISSPVIKGVRAGVGIGVASAKIAGISVGEVSAKVAGKVSAAAAKSSTKSAGAVLGKTAMRSIPFVNFGLAAWDTYETIQAGKELASGPEEEKVLREKALLLKQEANNIVEKIYNPFAVKQEMDIIQIPFPDMTT